jgi:hypothetical protein
VGNVIAVGISPYPPFGSAHCRRREVSTPFQDGPCSAHYNLNCGPCGDAAVKDACSIPVHGRLNKLALFNLVALKTAQ